MKKVLFILSTCWAFNAMAGQTANTENGIALKGYDPVTYFRSDKAQKGSQNISADDAGVKYLFANEENKKEFLKTPSKYKPAFEGWCATAVAGGYKYDIDPENYKITDGRLFLFYKGWKGDAKKDWVKNEPESIKKADSNWPKVRESKE